MVVCSVPTNQLCPEVLGEIKPMGGVEMFIILAVTVLHLAVVPGRVGHYELVADPQFTQCCLKERLFLCKTELHLFRPQPLV